VIESCCKLPPQTGFIILNTKGDVTTARDWARYFECICKRYNKMNSENIYVTPHICRHTFCSNLAMMDINPMKLQYFMGHEDINTTLKVYTKLDATRLVSECEQYNAKMW
jgi:site-specific recombinase XerD